MRDGSWSGIVVQGRELVTLADILFALCAPKYLAPLTSTRRSPRFAANFVATRFNSCPGSQNTVARRLRVGLLVSEARTD